MTHEQQIVWIAGLLEGEGYFQCYRPRTRPNTTSVFVQLAMTDKDVVNRASEVMGAKRVFAVLPRTASRQTIYRVFVHGVKAISLMRAILPFMGNRRKARIEEILKQWDVRSTKSDVMRGNKRAIGNRGNRGTVGPQTLFAVEKAS